MATGKGPVCVSVINMKGGVGKTTTATLLGHYASRNFGLKVLAIDLDPQANLSQAFMGERYRRFLNDRDSSIVELFNGVRPPASKSPSPTALDVSEIIVGKTQLGGLGLELVPSRFDFSDRLINSINTDRTVLARLIADHFQDKDLVLIDCAPTESILTHVAYQASRYVLVPVRPEYFATIGFPLLSESLEDFRKGNRGHAIDVAGVVINNWTYHYSGNRGGPERCRSIKEIRQESKKNGWHVFETQIPHSRGFPKIMRGDFNYLGDAPRFYNFAKEFFDYLGLDGKR